jgi:hypothetical protein
MWSNLTAMLSDGTSGYVSLPAELKRILSNGDLRDGVIPSRFLWVLCSPLTITCLVRAFTRDHLILVILSVISGLLTVGLVLTTLHLAILADVVHVPGTIEGSNKRLLYALAATILCPLLVPLSVYFRQKNDNS